MINIVGIKTNDGYYITVDNRNKNYSARELYNLLINGEASQATFNSNWCKITDEPKLIQQFVPQTAINKRFELKDKSFANKLKLEYMFDEVLCDEVYDYDDSIFRASFDSIRGLYEYKEDKQEPILQTVEFTFKTIFEIEEIKTPVEFSYKRVGKNNNDQYFPITDNNIIYDLISQITTPPILLHTQPCELPTHAKGDGMGFKGQRSN